MTEIVLTRSQYLELENIGLGAFNPLQGFMDEQAFSSVVRTMRLPSGDVFPLPVVLDVSADIASAIRGRPHVALVFAGEQVGTMTPESIYRCDKEKVVPEIFGTGDMRHPGVAQFIASGEYFVGGPINLEKRVKSDISDDELTPAETKKIFAERGWQTVAGFQTRNVPHRAHEYLQRIALEYVDGLFIQPLVGRKKAGDYTPAAIMRGYRTLIENYYPAGRVVLGILSTAMRYAGPREAVFHAIVRRNYGCTHFIIGRDHAGVGNYYKKYEAQELARGFAGELGISVLSLAGPYYCAKCDGIATERTCAHLSNAPEAIHEISGTDIRAILDKGSVPNSNIIRPDIVAALTGISLFVQESD